MKSKLILYSIIYGLTVSIWSIYWSTNFTQYTTSKGDEIIMLVKLLLAPTYILYFVSLATIKSENFLRNILLVIILPLVTCVGSVLIGFFTLMSTNLTGIPKHEILTYGLLYESITLLSAYLLWGLPKKK